MASICRYPRKRKLWKKNPTIEEDTSNLPCDIIENILSRLPVKSLLRFKSVSKPWYSLISNSKFARSHLNQTKNSDSKTLYLKSFLRAQTFTFLKLTHQNFQLESLVFPLKKYRQATVLSSCDGLVLMKNSRESDNMYVLWNPATRTYTKFSCKYPTMFGRSYGFCYDATSDDYKFVLSISETRYAIFSYKNNSWIEKEDNSPVRIMPDPWRGLFVNGALHWLATKSIENSESNANEDIVLQELHHKHCKGCGYRHNENCPVYKCNYNYTYEICYFDPRDDKFKKLSKPACFHISSVFNLTDLGGQLCLYRNTYDCKMIDIWTMKEYGDFDSWTKLVTIENVPAFYRCQYVKPLCLTNKNNIVLDIHGSGIFVYNLKENNLCEMLTGAQKRIRFEYMDLTPFLCWNDSLVLPSRS